jgi:hypothetical protein
MADDWRPSNYKPRGGWRAMLPGWRVVLAVLVACGAIAVKVIVVDGWRGDLSFNLMKILAVIVAMALVAPRLFSGKPAPKPGEFPTERNDARVRSVDDPNP